MGGIQSTLPTRMWTASREDSEVLADRIRNFWAVRGYEVKVEVGSIATFGDPQPVGGSTIYCIRSNMLNGFPPSNKSDPIRFSKFAVHGHHMVRA